MPQADSPESPDDFGPLTFWNRMSGSRDMSVSGLPPVFVASVLLRCEYLANG